MGASQNIAMTKEEAKLMIEATSKCNKPGGSNYIKWDKVRIEGCDPICAKIGSDCKLKINQSVGIDAKCYMENVIDNAASIISRVQQKADAGLGFATNITKTEAKTEITSKLEQLCEGVAAVNEITWRDVGVKNCGIDISQGLSVKDQCMLTAIQSNTSDTLSETTQAASGWGAGFGTYFLYIIIACVIISLIGGIGYYSYSQSQTGGLESDSLFENFTDSISSGGTMSYALMILFVVILVMLFMSNSSTKPITNITPNNQTQMPLDTPPTVKYINQNYYGFDPVEPYIPSDSCIIPYHDSLDTYYAPINKQ